MTVHERSRPPAGHGEVLCEPPFESWIGLAEASAAAAQEWPVELRELRACARAETAQEARRYSAELGISGQQEGTPDLIVMTGHQPELYHPGVWVKNFLVDRASRETGALGLDIVVDTDACGPITLRSPCLAGGVRVCESVLVPATPGAAYVQAALPDEAALAAFRATGAVSLRSLPAPAVLRHFETFCDALEAALPDSADLGTLMTAARRRYERTADTGYLEVLASRQLSLPSYLRFAAGLLREAPRFRDAMNAALGSYRMRTGTRSAAQPFPDLAERDGRCEVPFWILADGVRHPAFISVDGTLSASDAAVVVIGADGPGAEEALRRSGVVLAPKAITLTLFNRLFVADLFVHGTGGGRYDRVTDDVIRTFYGIEPPRFAVASMTLLLPLGAQVVTDQDVVVLERRLHRLEHNPDDLLGEMEFDTAEERLHAESLAAKKAALVAAIARPDADRKSLGAAIRAVNTSLAVQFEPVAQELRSLLEQAKAERDAAEVLTDRTYPYCLWDPLEIMDKVR